MALWHLIAAGIESRVAGTLRYLIRTVPGLERNNLISRAAERVIANMSMQDPEDRMLTHRISGEQLSVIEAAQLIQRGRIVGNLSQIPVSITYNAPPGDDVRYLLVVRLRDNATGSLVESRQEVTSDVPILYSDLRREAERRAMAQQGDVTVTGALGADRNLSVSSVSLISVSRRG